MKGSQIWGEGREGEGSQSQFITRLAGEDYCPVDGEVSCSASKLLGGGQLGLLGAGGLVGNEELCRSARFGGLLGGKKLCRSALQ